MSTRAYLKLLDHHRDKHIFRTSDFATMLDRPAASVRVELSRLASKGLVARLSKGLYANPYAPPRPEELAMVLRTPSYLSLESALARHGVLSQIPAEWTLVTTGSPRTFRALGQTFAYHHIQRSYFLGFEEQGTLLVALAEKALLDLVYLRVRRRRTLTGNRLLSLLDDMDTESLDPDLLHRYAVHMQLEPWIDRLVPSATG